MYDEFQDYLGENGIINKTTCVVTPAQNRVAERKNCHQLKVARALMFSMGLPKLIGGML